MSKEAMRLATDRAAWLAWGPYLADRAWGTVREDYGEDGEPWDYFPHDHARSRVYRWNEDGIAGFCDAEQRLCFALTLWNGRDPILKERFFGLSGPEGNHGEDVKEYWFHLDATPTHSYMRMLYKYPQREYPYGDLVATGSRRGKDEPEYELVDTGVFEGDRYFDVVVEYAKATPDDIAICIRAENRGDEPAPLHLLPTLWFRNTWSWEHGAPRPRLHRSHLARSGVVVDHPTLGRWRLACDDAEVVGPGRDAPTAPGDVATAASRTGDAVGPGEGRDPAPGRHPSLLFTENETNHERLFGTASASPWTKDAFHRLVVGGERNAVNPDETGTKCAAHVAALVPSGGSVTLRLRLVAEASTTRDGGTDPLADVDGVIAARRGEADEFYRELQPAGLDEDERLVQRQAFAGLLWTKQFYHYDVERWLDGDPAQPRPPASRLAGRNHQWRHLNACDILSMPDGWEYPWFAAWDLAFHCLPLALLDPEFAKEQLILLGREWYQHPSGAIPAYEWSFGDANPPVIAWAALRVYEIERARTGRADRAFLERVFHKMMLGFTWWVNRKDAQGNNVFEGGFLGMDNVGVFDRSAPLPTGGHVEQTDGTAWMAMFSLTLLRIALELALENPVYEDIATKFFEHFLYIVRAMNHVAGCGIRLWDETDEFHYDVLQADGRPPLPLRIRSIVGLVPLFAVTTIEPTTLSRVPQFAARLEWFLANRPDLAGLVSRWREPGLGDRRLLAILRGHRMKAVLRRALDPAEFLSPFGIRSLSRWHAENPFVFESGGVRSEVRYEPAESSTNLFGGNSNWRGPVWVPVNFLLIDALRRFHDYYSDDFRIEAPPGFGTTRSLGEVADDLADRLVSLLLRGPDGRRPALGENDLFQFDPHWRDALPFHEYFDGDRGNGLGASHQTGWTALVATLLQERGERRDRDAAPRSRDG